MIRVVHLISGLGLGGAEVSLAQLVLGLGDGFEHTVVSLTEGGEVAERLLAAGVPVHSPGMRRGWLTPAALVRLARLVRRLEPDILHTWMYHADFLGALLWPLVGRPPLVWSVREARRRLRDFGLRTSLTLVGCILLSGVPAVVLANSHRGREAHTRWGYRPKRWQVIPNGVDTRRFSPDEVARREVRASLGVGERAVVVGAVARYHPKKGYDLLLQAMAQVMSAREEVHLVMAGRGVEASNPVMERLLRAVPDPRRVHLLGQRLDVERLLASFDLFVSASRSEGFPNAVAEAMAAGVPCVVTDVGDAARIVGECGLVVPPGDPSALARAILSLLARPPESLRDLGARARKRVVTHFNLDRFIREYRDLYLSLISSDRT